MFEDSVHALDAEAEELARQEADMQDELDLSGPADSGGPSGGTGGGKKGKSGVKRDEELPDVEVQNLDAFLSGL